MTAGLVEPLSRPVGLEASVALAARGATGMLKVGNGKLELGHRRRGCLVSR